MLKRTAAVMGVLTLAACAGGTEEQFTISSVTVNTDLSAIQSRDAVDYWQNLSSDLETAIASEFVGAVDPSGHPLTVDVDELSLSETFSADATIDSAALAGVVTVGDIEPDGRPDPAYTVTATAQDATQYLQSENVVDIDPSTAGYYDAIVKAFASGAADAVRSGD